MKGILFLVVCLFTLSSANKCFKYQCAQADDANWTNQQDCLYGNTTTSTFTLWPCTSASKSFCQITNTLQDTFEACTTPEKPTVRNYPGESCVTDQECINGLGCSAQKVCVGRPKGHTCEQSAECDVGLFCSNDACAELVAEGGVCKSDTDCAMSSGCLITTGTTGKCTKYFSLEIGADTGDCSADTMLHSGWGKYSNFCKSATCETQGQSGVCTHPLKLTHIFSDPCTNNAGCPTSDGQQPPKQGTTTCTCSYNSEARAYCMPEVGDEAFTAYLSQLSQLFSADNLSKCHTDRHAKWGACLSIALGTGKTYQEFMVAQMNAMNQPLYEDNDWCVQGTMTANYWDYYYSYKTKPKAPHNPPWDHKKPDEDGSEAVALAIGLLAFITL